MGWSLILVASENIFAAKKNVVKIICIFREQSNSVAIMMATVKIAVSSRF